MKQLVRIEVGIVLDSFYISYLVNQYLKYAIHINSFRKKLGFRHTKEDRTLFLNVVK